MKASNTNFGCMQELDFQYLKLISTSSFFTVSRLAVNASIFLNILAQILRFWNNDYS